MLLTSTFARRLLHCLSSTAPCSKQAFPRNLICVSNTWHQQAA